MKRWIMATGVAALAVVAFVGTALAAGPYGARDQARLRDTDTVSKVLGLSHEAIMALRSEGLSLAQIADRQGVDTDVLVAGLTEQARERVAARVENGALSPAEAAQLQAQLEERVRARIADASPGGLGGVVGAGQGSGRGHGPGDGTGDCDGTGPNGRGGS